MLLSELQCKSGEVDIVGGSESPSSWQSQNQEEIECQHHLLTASLLCARYSSQAQVWWDCRGWIAAFFQRGGTGCYGFSLPSVCQLRCAPHEILLQALFGMMQFFSKLPTKKVGNPQFVIQADTISLLNQVHSKQFFFFLFLINNQSRSNHLWGAKSFIYTPPKSQQPSNRIWTWFAAPHFSSRRSSGWGITQKNCREKHFKEEVGRSLLPVEGGMGIAAGRSMGPLCRRGEGRKILQVSEQGKLNSEIVVWLFSKADIVGITEDNSQVWYFEIKAGDSLAATLISLWAPEITVSA